MASISPRLEYLLERNASMEMSGEERLELLKIVYEQQFDQEILEWMNSGRVRFNGGFTPDLATSEKIFEKIMQAEGVSVPLPQSGRLIKKNNYRFWAAAAAILILCFGTYLFVSKSNKHPVIPQIANVQDIAPGGNKAILTLGNGAKIILDSAHNGLLAHQGITKIIKTDSSKLIYSSPGEKSYEVSFNTLSTPRGGVFQVTLPDGTQAWLNAQSSITYPTRFTKTNREVSITGEAYFEVAKDASHPFFVKATNGVQVEVIGTHFDVNAYSDLEEGQVLTTLLEGSVKISSNEKSQIIKPEEQGIASHSGKNIQVLEHVDLDKIMGWQRGKMALGLVGVQQVMREISRWYDVDIEYQRKIPDAKFYIYLNRNAPLSSVLHVLDVYGVKTRLTDKKLIVL